MGIIFALLLWLNQLDFTQVLQERGATPATARRVSVAINKYAHELQLDPHLVLAIITVENPNLKPTAKNPSGATGIMQVMPGWVRLRPDWVRKCGRNLSHIETNVCFGTHVLAYHLADHPTSVRRGLLAFNGCKSKGPCRSYPDIVLKRAKDYAARKV